MDKNRILTMKSILKKETGEYLYKQNRTIAFNSYLESLNAVFYSIHKRNEVIFEGLKKSITEDIKNKVKNGNKLHIIFVHEPMDVPIENVYESHVAKRKIKDGVEGVILVDILPGRRGTMPKNNSVYAYWSMRDIANEYAAVMSFIYHLITDMFKIVQVHTDSTVYKGDVIVDFNYGSYLTQRVRPSYKGDLGDKFDWTSLRNVLGNKMAGVDSITSDPLTDTGVFKACADDFFMLLRVTIVDKYTKYLRQDSVNTKKRIDAITQNIKEAEINLITDDSDKQLEEMNDIMNTRMVKVGEYES